MFISVAAVHSDPCVLYTRITISFIVKNGIHVVLMFRRSEDKDGALRMVSGREFHELILDGRKDLDNNCVRQEMFCKLEELRRLYMVISLTCLGIR